MAVVCRLLLPGKHVCLPWKRVATFPTGSARSSSILSGFAEYARWRCKLARHLTSSLEFHDQRARDTLWALRDRRSLFPMLHDLEPLGATMLCMQQLLLVCHTAGAAAPAPAPPADALRRAEVHARAAWCSQAAHCSSTATGQALLDNHSNHVTSHCAYICRARHLVHSSQSYRLTLHPHMALPLHCAASPLIHVNPPRAPVCIIHCWYTDYGAPRPPWQRQGSNDGQVFIHS